MLDDLTPGYYAVLGQFDTRLVLACAGEDEDGDTFGSLGSEDLAF